jgi:hypothetical protein
MNQDDTIRIADIIRMADKANLETFEDEAMRFMRFAALVYEAGAAAEREACAKLCENIYTNGDGAECWLENAAKKIRARGNK